MGSNDSEKDGGDFRESSLSDGRKTFREKATENPMVPIGMGGAALAVLLSLGSYRKKDPNMKTSVYVIHTRMLAQGIVIGSMVAAMAVQLYQNHIKPKMDK